MWRIYCTILHGFIEYFFSDWSIAAFSDIANKNIPFHCRLWNPREPFKFRPEIFWGRMKQLQPVIYICILPSDPSTPHSHYFHIVLHSRPLRQGAESSSGALRDVQVLICALYSISTSTRRCVRNKPSRIPAESSTACASFNLERQMVQDAPFLCPPLHPDNAS